MRKLLIISEKKRKAGGWANHFTKKSFSVQVKNYAYLETMKTIHCDTVLFIADHPEALHKKWIKEIRKRDDNLPIILLGGKESIEEVVRLMKEGIFDYFAEPVDTKRLVLSTNHAMNTYQLTKRIFLL